MRTYTINWCNSQGDWKSINADGEAEAARLMGEIGPHLHMVIKASLSGDEARALRDHSPKAPFGFAPFALPRKGGGA